MSGTSDAFNAELDYLWRTIGEAQDASARSEQERAQARGRLQETAGKSVRLERHLGEALAREKALKEETELLRAALAGNTDAMVRAAAQAREAALLQDKLSKSENQGALLDARLEGLRCETFALREALQARDAAIETFKDKLSGLMALPEIQRALEQDSGAAGQPAAAYPELLRRMEKARRAAEKSAAELVLAQEKENAAREALAASEQELSSLRSALAARGGELAGLETALAAAAEKERISAGEKAALEGRAAALKASLAEKENALAQALSDCAALRGQLDGSRTEAERLRQAAAENSMRTEEQRSNFAGAVAQVFDLQKRAAALRSELAAAQAQNSAVAAQLGSREADLEKINSLLRESKAALGQEKEISRRAALKIKILETEMDGLKSRMAAAAEYSARVLRSVEERDIALTSAKEARRQDQKKITGLEAENEDLRRRNIRFSELLKREQADFTARMLAGLERSARELKNFNLRIPAAERKTLEPSLKNLLASVNLLKGWQEYLDPETPEMQDTDLAGFVPGEVAKWDRAFKQRKLAISAAVLNPRLRARLSQERVKMLFYNLIKNAYERLQPGGSLRVTLKGSEDGRLALITFEDTGPGFPQEALDKLYAPFNTTDKGRAGIGLAVASRIAEKHGGTLQIANKKERGAIIEVRLPLGSTAP